MFEATEYGIGLLCSSIPAILRQEPIDGKKNDPPTATIGPELEIGSSCQKCVDRGEGFSIPWLVIFCLSLSNRKLITIVGWL